jgi:glycine/D-amino acid oxidase-like deaminating enzyme
MAIATRPFDALVIGVGGMGSAALYHLARRGQRVLGLERFDIPPRPRLSASCRCWKP